MLILSNNSMGRSTPASCAIAVKCKTAFVDPPKAMSTRMAFKNAFKFMILRGVKFSLTTSTTLFPLSYAIIFFFEDTASEVPQNGSDMPKASDAHAIVFAVNIPEHAPAPGQAFKIKLSKSTLDIFFCLYAASASNVSWTKSNLCIL